MEKRNFKTNNKRIIGEGSNSLTCLNIMKLVIKGLALVIVLFSTGCDSLNHINILNKATEEITMAATKVAE